MPAPGGFIVSGSWPSASGIDLATHALTAARVEGKGGGAGIFIQALFGRDQFRIIDDWQVMGMRGTGSKRVAIDNVFVPAQRTVEAAGAGRPDPKTRPRLLDNPMYIGRVPCFLIGEAASVAVGADAARSIFTRRSCATSAPIIRRIRSGSRSRNSSTTLVARLR